MTILPNYAAQGVNLGVQTTEDKYRRMEQARQANYNMARYYYDLAYNPQLPLTPDQRSKLIDKGRVFLEPYLDTVNIETKDGKIVRVPYSAVPTSRQNQQGGKPNAPVYGGWDKNPPPPVGDKTSSSPSVGDVTDNVVANNGRFSISNIITQSPPPPPSGGASPSQAPFLIGKNKDNPECPWYFFQPGWWKKVNIIR